MSCYTCAQSFGFRRKEVGCKQCRRSFCTKCLTKKFASDSLGGTVPVCDGCFILLSSPPKSKVVHASTKPPSLEPPEALLKLQEQNEKDQPTADGPSQRLPVSAEDIIEQRLKDLKDEPTGRSRSKSEEWVQIYKRPATAEEQTQRLLDVYRNMAQIEEKYESEDPDRRLERRLKKLKSTDLPDPDVGPLDELPSEPLEELDEEDQVNRIIEQAADQLRLERRLAGCSLGHPMDAVGSDNVQDEELPWCVICNENAKLRCHDCDCDLYCSNCFKTCHNGAELADHRVDRFVPSKRQADQMDD